MRRFAAVLLLFTAPLAVDGQGLGTAGYARDRTFDLRHVKLDLALDLPARRLAGTATLRLAPLADGLEIVELDSVGLAIERITASGVPLRFHSTSDKLRIQLARAIAAGQAIDIAIRYSARPSKGLVFILPDKEHPGRSPQVWSQGFPEDNRYWFPVYDFPNDKATSELSITVPAGWQAVSNGRLISTAGGTFHWLQDKPQSTYLISLVAGEFDRVSEQADGIELSYYVPRGKSANVPLSFGRTADALRFFVSRLGPYPWAKYSQTVVDRFPYGARENTSATTVSSRLLLEPSLVEDMQASGDDTVAHELAHQWFGDLVTIEDFRHLWLSEGFATYFASLWTGHYYGRDRADWELLHRARDITGDLGAKAFPVVRQTGAKNDPVGLLAYQKGAWVLRMLHHQLGDNLFWKAMRLYLSKFSLRNVRTSDLVEAIADAAGKNVELLFDQYVYAPGHPELEATWHYDAGTQTVQLKIRQSKPLFRVPIDVELLGGAEGSARRFAILVDKEEEVFAFASAAKPATVILDPEEALLKKLVFHKQEAEWVYQLAHATRAVNRAEAALALGRRRIGAAAQAALVKAACGDSFFGVRVDAVRAMGVVRSEAFRSDMERLLESPLSPVRKAAAEELCALPLKDSTLSALVHKART
ncbi:MAG: M1 family aminopeptidase, partial [Bryobacteraceae bacterium]